MRHIKLSEHIFKKGKFITPFNNLPMVKEFEDEKSWAYGRMPEYLWIGLILNHYGRDEGLRKSYNIISLLHKLAPNLYTARLSEILKLDTDVQEALFEYVVSIGAKEVLNPLTVFLTVSKAPTFAKYFYCPNVSASERCETLVFTMSRIADHQSNDATDIRFVVLYFSVLSGKLHLHQSQIDLLRSYPVCDHADESMRMIRPTVRAAEMTILTFEKVDSLFLKEFWRCVSEMTDCNIFVTKFPSENREFTAYMERLHELFGYLSDLFVTTAPLDEKMVVLLGLATYSYKRLKEIYELRAFNSIAGRSCVRVMIEDYIMMKYLVFSEDDDITVPIKDRFIRALAELPYMVNPQKQDAYNFFMMVFGCIQQAIDIIASCIEYKCTPYIRYPVSLHYVNLLSENILDKEFMSKLCFKMNIAFAVHQLCDKDKLASVGFERFLEKQQQYDFDKKLLHALSMHGINEENFENRIVPQIVTDELEKFYGTLLVSE